MKKSKRALYQSNKRDAADDYVSSNVFIEESLKMDLNKTNESVEEEIKETDGFSDVIEWFEESSDETAEKTEDQADNREKIIFSPSAPLDDSPVSAASKNISSVLSYSKSESEQVNQIPQNDAVSKKKKRRWSPFVLLRGMGLCGMIILTLWAVYGVSLESNLAFWREVMGPDVIDPVQQFAGRIGEIVTLIGSVYP